MLYFSTRYVRQPDGRYRRTESVGFSSLVTALAVVRDLSEGSEEPGTTWLVTVRLGDGSHAPAVLGAGSGAAVMLRRGACDLEPPELLAAGGAS